MDSITDIIFDATEATQELRKETKAWASTLQAGADALNALFGKVKTTVKTVEKQAKRTVTAFDKLNRLEQKDVTITTTVTTQEGALQTVQEKFAGVMTFINGAISEFENIAIGVLQKIASWDSQGILQGLNNLTAGLTAVQNLLKSDFSMVLWLGTISAGIAAAGSRIGDLFSALHSITAGFSAIGSASSRVWNAISNLWSGAASWFSGKILDPITAFTKGTVNLLIGLLNAAVAAGAAAVNAVGKVLNLFSFTVPSWVPLLGGKHFGFSLPTVTAPQIPYLAQGAVLPANKPFLAVVGDQKHGTNVEAPLSTIQEAVSLVLNDQIGAITAGFEASVAVQREILEAVLGISIGDEVIANANDRYRSKMAVARGGAL